MSNVKAVEQAEKAKVDAMNKVAEEKQKTFMAKQNCREEINRINKKTNIKVACMKRELEIVLIKGERRCILERIFWGSRQLPIYLTIDL